MAPTTEKFTPDRVVMASKAGSSETANDCTPEDAAAAALHRVGDRWRLDLPGEHHALIPPLLAAGFRPERVFPLLASAPIGRWDRYVFADLDVL